jgi:NADPH:quinone reductase-like Zn-dependent oxidoreductase
VKAVYLPEPGGLGILICRDRPDPEAGAGEVGVLVRLRPGTVPISASVREACPRDVYHGFLPSTSRGRGARSRRSFAAMMHMVRRGGLRGMVNRTFELAQAGRAHEVAAGRDFLGTLVLRVP